MSRKAETTLTEVNTMYRIDEIQANGGQRGLYTDQRNRTYWLGELFHSYAWLFGNVQQLSSEKAQHNIGWQYVILLHLARLYGVSLRDDGRTLTRQVVHGPLLDLVGQYAAVAAHPTERGSYISAICVLSMLAVELGLTLEDCVDSAL